MPRITSCNSASLSWKQRYTAPGVRPACCAMRGMVVPSTPVLPQDLHCGLQELSQRLTAALLRRASPFPALFCPFSCQQNILASSATVAKTSTAAICL
jgi:hypothetical protein